MIISTKLSATTLALALSMISGVVSVSANAAQPAYVNDTSGNIDRAINRNSCLKYSDLTVIQIKLLDNNLVSVTCEKNAIKQIQISAQHGGYVDLNLSKGSC
jgi:hypothetical protein